MKGYILSIVAAAIVCAAARSLLTEKTAAGQLLRLLTGVLLAVTILKPLTSISFRHIPDYFDGITAEGQAFAQQGESYFQQNLTGIIIQQTEAYILDKANRMGLEISVEVELDNENNSIPCGVCISGNLSPYAKSVLSDYIVDSLGIPKENQRWM